MVMKPVFPPNASVRSAGSTSRPNKNRGLPCVHLASRFSSLLSSALFSRPLPTLRIAPANKTVTETDPFSRPKTPIRPSGLPAKGPVRVQPEWWARAAAAARQEKLAGTRHRKCLLKATRTNKRRNQRVPNTGKSPDISTSINTKTGIGKDSSKDKRRPINIQREDPHGKSADHTRRGDRIVWYCEASASSSFHLAPNGPVSEAFKASSLKDAAPRDSSPGGCFHCCHGAEATSRRFSDRRLDIDRWQVFGRWGATWATAPATDQPGSGKNPVNPPQQPKSRAPYDQHHHQRIHQYLLKSHQPSGLVNGCRQTESQNGVESH